MNDLQRLQRQVLEQLQKHGPCGQLVIFDLHRTANIGLAFVDLLQCKHVKRDQDNMVTITTAGLEWLESTKH